MKIYSWNILHSNKHISEIKSFIKSLDFDVLCLQEVPPHLLAWLKEFSKEIAYGIDGVEDNGGIEDYLVILSRHRIERSQTYEVPIPQRSLRAAFTIHLVRSLIERNIKTGSVIKRGGIFADVLVNGHAIRVHCLHLTIVGPGFRAKEFQTTLERRNKNVPEIIAGDFNIIEHPFIKIYSWLLGSPLGEGMPWFQERARFEEAIASEQLQNPLRGHITHPFSASQLDHILVSPQIEVTKAWVELDSHGSDHQPVGIECELVLN